MNPDRWKEISQLYHAALERTAGDRDEYLREACADDEELRREVQSLLDQPAAADGFLAQPAVAVAAQLVSRADMCRC